MMMTAAMGVVGAGMSLLGAGAAMKGGQVAAEGALYTGQANANMYNYQAQVATLNSKIATQNANYDIESGEILAENSGFAVAQQLGQTKAQMGASNLSVTSGSNAQVLKSEAETGAENEAMIRSNAAKAAYGEQVQAWQDTAQSTLDTAAAGYSIGGSQIQAQASILGGVSSAASKIGQLAMSFGTGGFGGGGGGSG